MAGDGLLKNYVEEFNRQDEETAVQCIGNEQAYEWLKDNIPMLECPDKEMEATYYFRWWVYRKHIKHTPEGYIITEFLPQVYWAGNYNSINCAAGHHICEGRWLANANTYMEDYIRFWLEGSGDIHSYSTWIADAVYEYCLVKGDFSVATHLLPKLVRNYEQWESDHLHESGLFWSIDDRDAMEYSISGNGLRPTLNSYMYADAVAIAKISALAHNQEWQERYEEKARRLKELVQKKLWDSEAEFFKVFPLEDKDTPVADWEFSHLSPERNVREEIGFIPWCFHLPDTGYEAAWKQLTQAEGFAAPYGPTTAEKRHTRFGYEQADHECLWNGPSWPFATTQTLTALANLLKDYRQSYVTEEDFHRIFSGYTHSHYRMTEKGERVHWIDENLDPYTGEWLSRKILKEWGWRADKGGYERGKDYNHSAYADLVIGKIFGIELQETGEIRIRPMFPKEWEYCKLMNVRCQGKKIDILYDKTGEVYREGKGCFVRCQGKCVHESLMPEEVTVNQSTMI